MRLFFGLGCSPQLQLQIDHWRDSTYKVLGTGVPAENFHVTLAFLGECKEQKLEAVLHAASSIQESQFNLHLDQLGYWHKPGVIWLGSSAAPKNIFSLARQCRSVAAKAKLYREKNSANRPYQPHLTLWRKQAAMPPAPIVAPAFSLQCTNFSLFESVALGRNNASASVRYRELECWPLRPVFNR
ncbi:MAG: RNA 2',3'-cyclic phosphodiesterase [Pseudomonadales bacterium]|nr:RNA 2',3'-cyclic phosphodiesterase [Gammaproteobacteria bacterium]NNL57041.1 RNA 2',3'-cyclic phosphodiesterase [Pseudomonadales bacterium]